MIALLTFAGLLLFATLIVLGALLAAWVDCLDDGGDR